MNDAQPILDRLEKGGARPGRDEMVTLLAIEDASLLERLFRLAYRIKVENVGAKVYFRGLIEYSNLCEKDCFYCGIRSSNPSVHRYQMADEEVLAATDWAHQNRYGSVVLQAGERQDPLFVDSIARLVAEIKRRSENRLGITLSLGEQSEETLRRWFAAGAHRYLLRIETANQELYARLHPGDHSWQARRDCLETLGRIGFQVGTGVMIGLPWQTLEDLADDILFFQQLDVGMIGMGPYLRHEGTPLAAGAPDLERERQLLLGLKMIAVTRIFLMDVNIASTTALQALRDEGRELGLKAGANVIMPNITDTKYRADYKLYEDKPCLDENANQCRQCLGERIAAIGETIGFDEWGDSPHFRKRGK